jgi:hypothetical protein
MHLLLYGTANHGGAPIRNRSARPLSVPEAGRRYFALGRNASYEAARRGEIPVIRIGRLLRVPVVALERKLEEIR